jgi:hypothetical protein
MLALYALHQTSCGLLADTCTKEAANGVATQNQDWRSCGEDEQIVMEEPAPIVASNPSYLYNPARSARC